MSKFLLFFCLSLFATTRIFSQAAPPRVQILSAETRLAPLYDSATATQVDTVRITLLLTGLYDTAVAANNTVSLTINNGTITTHSVFNDTGTGSTTLNIPASDWPLTATPVEKTYLLYIRTTGRASRMNGDQVGQIEITGHPISHHVLRYSNGAIAINTKYDPSKSFWVEIGSNFDLVDGLEANNLFSGVFFHKRDIRPLKRNGGRNVGVFAGIYESKTATNETEQNFSIRQFYDSSSFSSSDPAKMKIYNGVGNYITRRTVKNVGLFFSPQVRISNLSANEDGLHFFFSLWFDLQWQRIMEEKNFKVSTVLDTTKVDIATIGDYDISNFKKSIDIRSHYIGFGFPIFFRETTKQDDIVQLFINPVFGLSSQPTTDYLNRIEHATDKDLSTIKRPWSPFYTVQFRLNEEKYGISFTGEVRGLLKNNNKPLVSLALSKKFDLTKFMEFSK